MLQCFEGGNTIEICKGIVIMPNWSLENYGSYELDCCKHINTRLLTVKLVDSCSSSRLLQFVLKANAKITRASTNILGHT